MRKTVAKTSDMRDEGRRALDDLYSAVYGELRRLAAQVRRDDPSATLTPTSLVHEAWLKLAQSPPSGVTSRLHFKRIAARAMRQVLVEGARRRNARKRAAGADAVMVPLGTTEPSGGSAVDIVALDTALRALAELDPRQAAVVEGRFFGGLDNNELAELLDVSPSTVRSDWRMARAWLHAELSAR